MSVPLTRWTSWLSLGDRGARAIEQACRDWRHEAAQAGTTGGLMLAHARSIVGLGRLTFVLLFEEMAAAITSGWGLWMLAWILLPVAVNRLTLTSSPRGLAGGALADYQILMQFTPVFAFLALASGRRRSVAPILGIVALVALVFSVVGRFGWSVVWTYMVRDDAAWWERIFHGHAPGQATWWLIAVSIWSAVAMILLGDRVRRDRSRVLLLLLTAAVFFGTYFASLYIRNYASLWGVSAFDGADPLWYSLWRAWERAIQTPLGRPRPMVILAFWALLIWRQRRSTEAVV